MAGIRVQIDVSREAAIRRGSTVFGHVRLELTDADLAQLSADERDELARQNGYWGDGTDRRLGLDQGIPPVEEAGLAGVRASLAAQRARRLQKEAEQAAKQEQEAALERRALDWALAADLGDLVAQDPYRRAASRVQHAPREAVGEYGVAIPWDAPALSTRRSEVAAEAERIEAQMKADHERYKAEEKAKEDAAEQVKIAAKLEFRAYALDGLAGAAARRGAQEEYDIRAPVLDAVQARLPTPNAVSRPSDDYSWEERTAPTEDAFALLDEIAAASKAVLNKPACVSLTISRVMRIEEPEYEEGGCLKHTGVVVTIASPITDNRYLLYYVD